MLPRQMGKIVMTKCGEYLDKIKREKNDCLTVGCRHDMGVFSHNGPGGTSGLYPPAFGTDDGRYHQMEKD